MTSIPKIPEEVKCVISLMNYIGNVGYNQKLFFRERIYVSEIDFQNRIMRYFYGENLESNLKIIKKIFRSYIVVKIHYGDRYSRNLDEAFRNFYEGILKLKQTYMNKDLDRFYIFIDNYFNMLI
jgi:hypothetical protein